METMVNMSVRDFEVAELAHLVSLLADQELYVRATTANFHVSFDAEAEALGQVMHEIGVVALDRGGKGGKRSGS